MVRRWDRRHHMILANSRGMIGSGGCENGLPDPVVRGKVGTEECKGKFM